MSEERLSRAFWEHYFAAYDVLNKAIPYQELLGTLVQALSIKNGDVVLDAGCGTCNVSIKLAIAGAHVTALDSSSVGLSICKKKNTSLEVVNHNLEEKLPFPDNTFDKIASNNTLYLIGREERKNTMKEFYRVLKPGGLIALSNLHTSFKPLHIYKEHIRLSQKRFGLMRTVIQVMELVVPTMKIFYYNNKIKKSHTSTNEKTAFFNIDEQEILLKEVGFKNVSATEIVYASQGILNTARK